MPKEIKTKIYVREIYPVCDKRFLGIFKIEEVRFADKLGTELIIESNDNFDSITAIYFNGKKIYDSKQTYAKRN